MLSRGAILPCMYRYSATDILIVTRSGPVPGTKQMDMT